MNQKTYSQILDRVARESLAANTDLAPRILARIQKGKNTTMQPRTKVFAAVFLILLVLVIGLVSVPAVRAAIQRWISYVPGIGLVSEGQIRVLAEPVSVTRYGITLKVEQVLIDSTQTTVVYSVEGLTMDMLDSHPRVNGPGCYKDAILHLPEEELSPTSQSGKSWITGYQHRASYPVIPSTVNELTFELPCIRSVMSGKAPENWDLAFRLIPAPTDMTAFPVIEISTPVAATVTPLPPADTTDTSAELSAERISLSLDRAVQMDDGYLIYATLHWENTGFSSVDMFDQTTLHLLDANGQEIAYNLDSEEITESNFPNLQRGQQPLVIKTEPILVPGPVTLVIEALGVTVALPEETTFTFDPGSDPQPGQTWELNQDIDLGYGHSLRVLRAVYPTPPEEYLPQQAGFSFEMQSDTGVTGAMLYDHGNPLAGSGGSGTGDFSNIFTSVFSYETLPESPITVNIESISVKLTGHWEASWTPPALQAIPTSQSNACINRESWLKALQAPPSLPTGLSGTLAIADLRSSDFQYEVSIARFDGSEQKSIGLGFAPSLSPDGTRVAYMGPWIDGPADGLYITDLASGNTSRLPGTQTGDLNPLWSPDGTKIAFTRGPASGLAAAPGAYIVVVMDADGSDLRQLTDAAGVNYAVAWMPDGDHLLYNTPIRDGVALYNMDVQSGESSFMFENNMSGGVAVSPDGKRLAFEEKLPLDKFGLFVSKLDGSDRIQLGDGDPYLTTVPAWSPDGNWLIATVHDPIMSSQPNGTMALIGVDTCQIIPLPNLLGYVFSWRP